MMSYQQKIIKRVCTIFLEVLMSRIQYYISVDLFDQDKSESKPTDMH